MRILLLLIIMVGLTKVTLAEETESGWPSGSAMDTGFIVAKERDQTVEALKQKHKKLVDFVASILGSGVRGGLNHDGMGKRLAHALQTSQNAWLEYYPQECELVGSLSGSGGSWPSTYAVRCQRNLLHKRISNINSAQKCIEKLAVEQREFGMEKCLYQLAPLAWKM